MTVTETNVLLVEDHDDTRAVLARVFECGGYRATAVASAAEAIEAVRESSFELAVIDWSLPDGDGGWLLRRLREVRAMPAIACSGYGDDDHVRCCYDAGFDSHMTKPVTVEALLSEVGRVLETNLCTGPGA
jgi:CheY-like chemotaxis protein